MNAFIAPVVAQSAITNPTMVITTLVAGWSFRRCRLSLRSVTVSFGAIWPRCCMRLLIVSGPATSVNRPVATRSVEGMARNAL